MVEVVAQVEDVNPASWMWWPGGAGGGGQLDLVLGGEPEQGCGGAGVQTLVVEVEVQVKT